MIEWFRKLALDVTLLRDMGLAISGRYVVVVRHLIVI
jgi:hypothetical protein